ncbi:MAG: hypothetical protein AAFZ15_28220 [Bacteroidota bacterium]
MSDYLNLIVEVGVTIYVFLLGLPLLVSQIFLPEDLRRFSRKNYTTRIWWHLGLLTLLILLLVGIAFAGSMAESRSATAALPDWYSWLASALFLALLIASFWFLIKYLFNSPGSRANIIGLIKNKIIKIYQRTGELDQHFINDLEYLGIYSKAGGEIQYVIEALNDLLEIILNQPSEKINSEDLKKIIDILCNSVAGTVEPGSRRNMINVLTTYKGIIMWLEEKPAETVALNLNDIAPKLQSCTNQIALVSLRKDYIDLMPRILNVITLLAQPSVRLFNIGILALERDHFRIAANALSELLDADNRDEFSTANYFGLLAHFYCAGPTAQKHTLDSLKTSPLKIGSKDFDNIINYHYSSAHFKTVDNLEFLKEELLEGF